MTNPVLDLAIHDWANPGYWSSHRNWHQHTLNRILDFFAFIPFLQDVQSVDQDGLCMGNRGFGF